MDLPGLRDALTDAIKYWEPRRALYNAILTAIVLTYFGLNYPASRKMLSVDSLLLVFILAVLANIAYCAAYVADLFAQLSAFRPAWLRYRWILLAVGVLFAGTLTRWFAMALFSSAANSNHPVWTN